MVKDKVELLTLIPKRSIYSISTLYKLLTMKKIIPFLLCWFMLGASAQTSQPDSLLAANLASLDEINPYDLCYEFKDVLKKSCDRITKDNFSVIDQGDNLCLISQPRFHLQILIDNYRLKRKNFSVSILLEDEKYIYWENRDGNGGYYKNDPDGYLVLGSVFLTTERFRPMSRAEIRFFNERLVRALYLALLTQPTD